MIKKYSIYPKKRQEKRLDDTNRKKYRKEVAR